MKICVIGTGYVGLVSGTCFSDIQHDVVCVDLDEMKVARLRTGAIPIHEPGLDEVVQRNLLAKRLSFTTDLRDAFDAGCSMFFVAVGTPTNPIDGSANLEYVRAAVDGIGTELARRPDHTSPVVVVTKSTVPVGTNRDLADIMARHVDPSRFAIASNPEFLREGSALHDFMHPDRIVVGSACEKARAMLEELYRPLTRQGYPMIVVEDVQTAEIIKYAANAFLATKITFMNQVARLCEAASANVQDVIRGVGADGRIGAAFLNPGPGYGGSCFPKDTQALVHTAEQFGTSLTVVEAVIEANERHKRSMVARVSDAVGGSLDGKRVAVLGLAFKANTDDMRDAPSLTILPDLNDLGATIVAYDPVAATNAKRSLPFIHVRDTVSETVEDADVVLVLTEWKEFHGIDPSELVKGMRSPVIVDLRNVVSRNDLSGFEGDLHAIGHPSHLRRGTAASNALDQVAA